MRVLAMAGATALLFAASSAAAAPAWREQATLAAPNGRINDGMGGCTAISDGVAVFGAPGRTLAAASGDVLEAGALYVFTSKNGVWALTQTLAPADLSAKSYFGASCALSIDHLVVGALGKTTAGTAYVYKLAAGAFTLEQKLSGGDGQAGDHFGVSCAIDASTIVVGAESMPPTSGRGAAYVFSRKATGWSAPQKLLPGDGMSADAFGWSVAVDGATVLVGALGKNNFRGNVYAFANSGGTWAEQQKLDASDAVDGNQLGVSLDLRGDTAVVGAAALQSPGGAYVYTRAAGVWSEKQKLAGPALVSDDAFGRSVAISSTHIFVGAPSGRAREGGGVYPFVRSGATWTQLPRLQASDAAPLAHFGAAVRAVGSTLAIGAEGHLSNRGQGYVFAYASGPGDACTSAVACSTGFCVDGVCCNEACGGGVPNDCQVCSAAEGATMNGVCGPAAKTVVCRPEAGECDVADSCDGLTTTCPADVVRTSGAACAGGACVAGVCSRGAVPEASGGDAGSGGVDVPADEGGCRVFPRGAPSPWALLPLAAFALARARRKWRS